MPDYVPCVQCGEEVTRDSDFCPHCGIMFEGKESVQCENHPERKGTAVCIVCRRVLCDACTRKRKGKRFCSDHAKVHVEQDWAVAYESTEINDAELVRSVLENAGFHVQVRNFNSVGFVWDGGGDSPQSRSNLSKPARVFVPIPEFLKAQGMIHEWESGKVEDQ